ncbi:MAG: Hsp70 family protein [Lachnospiraceae bacterium]|nr:Hsp70 family protein [Lachnospiraceae bacterium]
MVIGIDLGTTYSLGAYIDDKGEAEIIPNSEGENKTPSVVYFESADSVVVGKAAKMNSGMYPDDVVSAVKNFMGKQKKISSSYGKTYTPESISSFILKKIVSDAGTFLNASEPIKDVVVTIPAYFTDAQRKATEDAVNIAGLNLVGTINEPTAAALYYATKSKLDHANVLIYDLGGGTFDVTIIRVDGDSVEVKSTGGLSNVGGRFFDEKIVEFVCETFEELHDIDLEDDEYEYQELFVRAEDAKIQLSKQAKAVIPVRVGKIRENIEITREFFNECIENFYKRSEYIVKTAISEAGLKVEDIDKAILVGGSSRIPYIEERLGKLLNMPLSREGNPDEVVALGAALYGKQLTGNNANKKIQDVCSHSIGIAVVDMATKQRVNSILIPRNSKLPATVSRSFRTVVENQTEVELTITEGEFVELTDVTILNSTKIVLPEKLRQGTKIEIRLQLDEAQLLHVFMVIVDINYEKEYKFERITNLSEEDVVMLTGLIADYEVR